MSFFEYPRLPSSSILGGRVAALFSFLAVLLGQGELERAGLNAEEPPAKTVAVTIDYGDGVEKRFTEIPWSEGQTVQDAMRAAEKHRRGIKLQSRGSGATTMLLAIDDLKNEGGAGRGWLYRVNGKLGDKSYALHKLAPGDAVLWKFEKYR